MTMSTWMRAGGSTNLCFGEVELDTAHGAGNFAALEVLGTVALICLAHRDGNVEVASGTLVGIGLRVTLLAMASSFTTAASPAVVAGTAGNDGYADKDDGDGPHVVPLEHIEQHELNGGRDCYHHDWARSPLESLRYEQIQAP